MDSKIILPLDNLPWEDAQLIMQQTQGLVWGYKIRRSILDRGLAAIQEIKRYGRVMLDFKLYDIPSAMTESLTQHLKAGADISTIHCTACYVPQAHGLTGDHIAGVTILTSMGNEDFKRHYKCQSIAEMVTQMARIASQHYEYLVCSPQELGQIRTLPIKKICPGVRPEWYQVKDDQRRTATPAKAMTDGAELLVIGRPILNAKDIISAIQQTNDEIAGG
jgi:orotidine-5'-phosphate decarboxylase